MAGSGDAVIGIECAQQGRLLPPDWVAVTRVWDVLFPDGEPVVIDAGVNGDYAIFRDGEATFHIAREGAAIRCAATVPGDTASCRFLLDTVLWFTSLVRGHQAVHASAVAIQGRAVLLMAQTGWGKSTLATALLQRGAALVADDVVVLEQNDDGVIVAQPGPPVMNLPIRELGASRSESWFAEELASFPDESWISVRNVVGSPVQLEAIVLLDRRSEGEVSLTPLSCTPLDLLPHALKLPGVSVGEEEMFELFSAVAAGAGTYSLKAPGDADPRRLAELVEGVLEPARGAFAGASA